MVDEQGARLMAGGSPQPTGRVTLADELQGAVVALIDLSLLAKQLLWCTSEPGTDALRAQLDLVTDRLRTRTDEIAARMLALGHVPNGQSRAVAIETNLAPLPARLMPPRTVAHELEKRMRAVSVQLQRGRHALGDDCTTAELLAAVQAELERDRAAICVHLS